ncbi:D-aspartate ligase [bioreactor metagenome]|uniref:D-aspartate ligase n=1 Tax=bioreactor metagenome TaxID=1076179 RepID=A0A644Y8J4_9ZZZZ
MAHNFRPLLFGGDINVYSVARAFHEAYGLTSTCYGKYPTGPAFDSAIIDYRVCAENEDADVFRSNVADFAAGHPDETILVVGCGDSYVKLCAENKGSFPSNCITPYGPGELINMLINKEKFYALCDECGIAHPDTFIHRKEMGHDFALPFAPPFICKPADGVSYWAHPFPGNEKVFICRDRASLENVLDKVYASGYPESMIIQDFIPGDDSYMRVLTNYSDRGGQVKLMCLGHVLLEEHTPHGSGNHAVILTEYEPELCTQIKTLLEDLHFVGFSNFDIKFDQRDGKYKLFEINCRQGRSNFYVTGAGYNIAKLLVDDYIEENELPFTVADRRSLWRVVPRKVAFDYTPHKYHEEMKTLIREGKGTNPLFYGPDRAPKRLFRLWKNQLGHFVKFKQYYHKPG